MFPGSEVRALGLAFGFGVWCLQGLFSSQEMQKKSAPEPVCMPLEDVRVIETALQYSKVTFTMVSIHCLLIKIHNVRI